MLWQMFRRYFILICKIYMFCDIHVYWWHHSFKTNFLKHIFNPIILHKYMVQQYDASYTWELVCCCYIRSNIHAFFKCVCDFGIYVCNKEEWWDHVFSSWLMRSLTILHVYDTCVLDDFSLFFDWFLKIYYYFAKVCVASMIKSEEIFDFRLILTQLTTRT